jgi:NAD(P)-dependent dehydrogenase (short-subunit alcohol dehydrogenase family)
MQRLLPELPEDPKGLFDIRGRVVLIVGALGLLGTEIASAFAKCEARVVLADINGERCEAVAADLARETGSDTLGIPLDTADSASVSNVVRQIVIRFGKLDVLINAAQYKSPHFFQPFEEFPLQDWEAVLRVNLTGTFLCCQAVGNQMIAQGNGGSIINVGSTYGVVAPNQTLYEGTSLGSPAAYSASKAGVMMLSQYLAAYWGHHNIRVNSVQPHGLYNDHEQRFIENFAAMSPLGRMSLPREVVGCLLFLASDASTYVTGANFPIDGGWTAW